MTDPYQVLGISPNATDDEVKKAYKELSRKYHPDSYANNPLADLAEDKFKEVQAAYTQIMNSRANGGSGYSQGYQNGYNNSSQGGYTNGGYNNGGYNSGNAQGGYTNGNANGQYNRQSYQNYGQGYGRNPNGYYGSGGCSTGNIDLCSCI